MSRTRTPRRGTSRREILSLGTAAGAAALAGALPGCRGRDKADDTGPVADTGLAATPARAPEPDPWEPDGAEDTARFPFGVQAGDASATGVLLSVRTRGDAPLRLEVVRAEGGAWAPHGSTPELLPDDEGVVQHALGDLEPDTAYAYAFYDATGARSRAGRFRTALGDDGWRVVTFGATSCLGGNDPWPNLSHAAAERLDLLALLGDTVYADGAVTLEEYREHWRLALSTRGLLEATASTSVVATWDDHEVMDNSGYDLTTDEQRAAALQAFREALPQGRGPGGTGIWRVLRWGAVLDVFVLDCRGEREADRYISDEQMQWLKDGLAASTARFKIILNSVPITDLTAFFGDVMSFDRWQGYPAQRAEVLGWIADQGIAGVLWVAGDLHYAQVGRVDPEGGVAWDQWEVLAGPSGSRINIAAAAYQGDEQYPVVLAEWNYCRFTCDPGAGTVRVEHVGDDGGVLSDMTLSL